MKNTTRFFSAPSRVLMGTGLAFTAILSMTTSVFASTLTRQLEQGNTGTDVSSLQTFLAQDHTIYPQGLVTGYYGTLTTSAVSNFQARNNIASVGRVGPVTLLAINAQMSGGMSDSADTVAPTISNVSTSISRNNATITWNTDQMANGVIYYSTIPLTEGEHLNSVDVSGNTAMTDTTFRTAQNVSIQNLQSNTVYYYLIYTTDQAGNVSVTVPATFQTSN